MRFLLPCQQKQFVLSSVEAYVQRAWGGFPENVPESVEVTYVLVSTAFKKPHVNKKVYKWPVRPP